MHFSRSGGILLHPTSLPGAHGIGSMGHSAVEFLHILLKSELKLWQVLPLGPTGYGNSPYQTLSAFAGNTLLISLNSLVEYGLLQPGDLEDAPDFEATRVEFGKVIPFYAAKLEQAWNNFSGTSHPQLHAEFDSFCHLNASWLEDYALFRALKDAHGGAAWTDWESELVHREQHALTVWRSKLAEKIDAIRFEQYLFSKQWSEIKAAANDLGIKIIGDIPIFLAHDSSDVWANPHLFYLDDDGRPSVVAGVPPDYFSETGQLWGNPLYRWDVVEQDGFSWWVERMRTTLEKVDIIRIDHFRGFESYWEIPAGEETAINGRWVKAPGEALFNTLLQTFGKLPIIAEDLGLITREVEHLRDQFGFPGMRILQFAFGDDEGSRFYLPHNYHANTVVYTGTHDNDTSVGWFRSEGNGNTTRTPEMVQQERERALKFFNSDGSEVHWDFIRMAFGSVANMAIIPMQDVLGLDSSARMNIPGTADGNWEWRFCRDQLSEETLSRLAELASLYERTGPANLLP